MCLCVHQPLYKLLAEVEEKIKGQEEERRHSARDTLDYREAVRDQHQQQKVQPELGRQQQKDRQQQQQRNAWSWRTRSCNDSVLPGTSDVSGVVPGVGREGARGTRHHYTVGSTRPASSLTRRSSCSTGGAGVLADSLGGGGAEQALDGQPGGGHRGLEAPARGVPHGYTLAGQRARRAGLALRVERREARTTQ